jgi:prevent-host-death family protein
MRVHEAKTQLSKLLERVEAGEEIAITRRGGEVARLVPSANRRSPRFGIDRGVWEVPEDFDAPLPDDVISEFEQ